MFEFNFVKERKAETVLENACSSAVSTLLALAPFERAAALAWCNAALLAGVREYGKEFAHKPMALTKDAAIRAIMDFAAYRRQAEDSVDAVQGRAGHDPAVAAFRWELAAAQCVIVTAGVSFDEEARKTAREIWRLFDAARAHAPEGVRAMLLYGKAYDVETIPKVPNKKGDKAFLLALASNLPPMFRRK